MQGSRLSALLVTGVGSGTLTSDHKVDMVGEQIPEYSGLVLTMICLNLRVHVFFQSPRLHNLSIIVYSVAHPLMFRVTSC